MAIALVQSAESNSGAGATNTIALTSIAAGNAIIICTSSHTNITISGVADDLSVAGGLAVTAYDATTNDRLGIYAFLNHGGGTRTFTVTFSGNTVNRYTVASEWSGMALASAFEGKATAATNGANPSTGNLDVTPSVNGELIIGFTNGDNAATAGTNFTLLQSDGVNTLAHAEYYIQPTAAAIAATWTMTSGNYQCIAASFKAAAGGGGSNHVPGKMGLYRRMKD